MDLNILDLKKYEEGKKEPSISTWLKLSHYYEKPVTYLMGISKTDDLKVFEQPEKLPDYMEKKDLYEVPEVAMINEEQIIQDWYKINKVMQSLNEINSYDHIDKVDSASRIEKNVKKVNNVLALDTVVDAVIAIYVMYTSLFSENKERVNRSKEFVPKVENLLMKYFDFEDMDDGSIDQNEEIAKVAEDATEFNLRKIDAATRNQFRIR